MTDDILFNEDASYGTHMSDMNHIIDELNDEINYKAMEMSRLTDQLASLRRENKELIGRLGFYREALRIAVESPERDLPCTSQFRSTITESGEIDVIPV
jgi:mevalonate kinase